MAFADILKDESTYPDTAEISVGGQQVTLGQIRDLSRADKKAIADQMDTLTRERNEVKDLATKTADLYTKLQADMATAATTRNTPPEANDFDNDEWWKPVRAKLTPLEKQITDLLAAQQATQKMVEQAGLIFANDRWKSQYNSKADRLKSDKYKDYTFEKVREYAAANKILDEYGIPALDKAIETITREDELDRIRREAFEAGQKEGITKGRLNVMPRPSSASGGKTNVSKDSGLDPARNFDDLGDAVMDDPDLVKMLANLGAVDPNEIM